MPPEGSDLIFDHRHNADVSEFCLCILMQRSASPFAIGNPPLVSG
jgi:hypothetical protein